MIEGNQRLHYKPSYTIQHNGCKQRCKERKGERSLGKHVEKTMLDFIGIHKSTGPGKIS